jgi:hypothetical protein
MKYIALVAQIAALTFGFSANRADALAGAAIFAVLCVVVVFVKEGRVETARRVFK